MDEDIDTSYDIINTGFYSHSVVEMEEKSKKKKLLIILLLFLALALIGYLYNRLVVNKSTSLKGKIIDGETGQAISDGAWVAYQGNRYIPDIQGEFVIEEFKPNLNTVLEINERQLFSPLKIDVGIKRYIEIPIHRGAEIVLEKFIHDMANAQYRKNYEVIDDDIKSRYSEDSFLRKANNFSLAYKKQGYKISMVDYAMADGNHVATINGTTYDKVIRISVDFELTNSQKNTTEHVIKQTSFHNSESGWKWLYMEDFFEIRLL